MIKILILAMLLAIGLGWQLHAIYLLVENDYHQFTAPKFITVYRKIPNISWIETDSTLEITRIYER